MIPWGGLWNNWKHCLKLTPNTHREFCWDFHLSKAHFENMIHFAKKKQKNRGPKEWLKCCLNVVNILWFCVTAFLIVNYLPVRSPSSPKPLCYNIITTTGRRGKHEFWEQRSRGEEEAYRWAGSPQRCRRGPGGRQTSCRPRAPFPAPRAPERPAPAAQWSIHLHRCGSCPPVMEEKKQGKKKKKAQDWL